MKDIATITITDPAANAGEDKASLLARDRETALHDLMQESRFRPAQDAPGPFSLTLSMIENRLVFDIKTAEQTDLPSLVLSLTPYRSLIRDYFLIVHSYEEALRDGKPSRIEAIDMGRRALHNEGAALLMDRLQSRIDLDMPTARRLFTLICVLQAGRVHAKR